MAATFEVFFVFLRLGCTSFGGPIAHIGFFHNEFVTRRKWLEESAFQDLVSICQFLPGPASSQIGMAIGLSRSGFAGALAAWLGFTLPTALLFYFFAVGLSLFQNSLSVAWIIGFKIAAVPIVAQAVWFMARKFCVNPTTIVLAFFSALVSIALPSTLFQLLTLSTCGLTAWLIYRRGQILPMPSVVVKYSKRWAVFSLGLFGTILALSIFQNQSSEWPSLQLFLNFFRVGSLVFGGGHVVLPLMQAQLVQPGWVSQDAFIAGYGAAQAMPGPLFSISSYIGAIAQIGPGGWLGSLLCLFAIFLPSILLIIGVLPFWENLRTTPALRSAMAGVNAAVVGLLFAAFYNPICFSSIHNIKDGALALFLLLILMILRLPSWSLVLISLVAARLIYH